VYLVPTLIGALAVLAATIAIPPMISGDTWFWPAVEIVLVIWLVGVGARLAKVPAAAVVLLQIAGASIALTALYTVGGFGGVIPNGAVLNEAGDLLVGAWNQIRTTVSPAPASTELSFLICVTVGVTALIVDILIAVCRAPALVALPLLCVFSVPASIDVSMLPWAAFAGPAMLYALLLVASGLNGRRLGAGAGVAQVVSGVALASIATVIALLVAGSVTGVGTAGRLPRSTNGPSTGIGLSPFASLQGNLKRGDPVDMLRVSGLDQGRYLRTVGLQKWTGKGWEVDDLANGQLPDAPQPADQPQITVTSLAYKDQFLPIYNGTTTVTGVGQGWSYDSALESVHRDDAVTPGPYQIAAAFTAPSADDLRADTVTPGGTLTDTGDLRRDVVQIAQQVTAQATTAFDKADQLRNYFTNPVNGFTYSLNVPAGNSGDLLADFLSNKQGYCEQYASAMAIMLRAVGVPARVAIGFTQGSRDANGDYLISSNDAHAWVEVLFDKAGWVEFDPTPLGGGQGGRQGFTDTAPATPTTGVTGSGLSSTQPNSDDAIPLGGGAAVVPTQGSTVAGASSDVPADLTGLWLALGALIVAAAAAAGPTLVRNRRRRVRLAQADAGGRAGAAAAWREIEDLAVDHGVGLNPADSARAIANRLAKTAHLSDQGRADLRAVVTLAEQGWYGVGEPMEPAEATGSVPGSPTVSVPRQPYAAASPASAAATSRASTATLDSSAAGTSLGAAPRSLALALQHNVPLSPLDRMVPRSVRPAWWRD
jgi:transglutaminase-like putative cysteine protease